MDSLENATPARSLEFLAPTPEIQSTPVVLDSSPSGGRDVRARNRGRRSVRLAAQNESPSPSPSSRAKPRNFTCDKFLEEASEVNMRSLLRSLEPGPAVDTEEQSQSDDAGSPVPVASGEHAQQAEESSITQNIATESRTDPKSSEPATDYTASEASPIPEPSPEASLESSSLRKKGSDIQTLNQQICRVIRASYEYTSGQTYTFFDPTGDSVFFKIGKSNDGMTRQADLRRKLGFTNWEMLLEPPTPIPEPERLEKLAHAELNNLQYPFKCNNDKCATTSHKEFFEGKPEEGQKVIKSWGEWLSRYSPYDANGKLEAFWDHRLEMFMSDIPRYYNCGAPKCVPAQRDERSQACQACMRTGWRQFTEPWWPEIIAYYVSYRAMPLVLDGRLYLAGVFLYFFALISPRDLWRLEHVLLALTTYHFTRQDWPQGEPFQAGHQLTPRKRATNQRRTPNKEGSVSPPASQRKETPKGQGPCPSVSSAAGSTNKRVNMASSAEKRANTTGSTSKRSSTAGSSGKRVALSSASA